MEGKRGVQPPDSSSLVWPPDREREIESWDLKRRGKITRIVGRQLQSSAMFISMLLQMAAMGFSQLMLVVREIVYNEGRRRMAAIQATRVEMLALGES